MPNGLRWLGAVEAYYGQPLQHEQRAALVEWLAGHGFNTYGYAPKSDPFHRDRWREPYPADDAHQFAELIASGARSGRSVAMGISPGLDWKDGDVEPLIAKLASFRELGCDTLAIAFDDVTPGGHDLGSVHGSAVAAAVEAMGDGVRWFTCPTDYATAEVTPYLRGFVAELPDEVDVMWTGPSVISPRVTGADVDRFAEGLGRAPIFAENYPVNDGSMEGVLHIGPYPERTAEVAAKTTGVFCNFMRWPLASRVGLAAAARWWLDPTGDREEQWRDVLTEFDGLEPLARVSRGWVGRDPVDPEIRSWFDNDDPRFAAFLDAGCRDSLDPALAAEIEPWLAQWDVAALAMQYAARLIDEHPGCPAELAFAVHELWRRTWAAREEVFGIRWAAYPVTRWADGQFHALPEAVIRGDNLVDRRCARALLLDD